MNRANQETTIQMQISKLTKITTVMTKDDDGYFQCCHTLRRVLQLLPGDCLAFVRFIFTFLHFYEISGKQVAAAAITIMQILALASEPFRPGKVQCQPNALLSHEDLISSSM